MAGPDRTASHVVALYQALEREPYGFDFFHTLRRLECAFRQQPRIGESVRAAEDPVRLAQEPSLAFAPSTLASFRPAQGDRPARLAVFFLGLLGPNGPLPLHLTEYARDRLRNSSDPTFVRFLDLFHHRMLSLFYRAWAGAQPAVNFDRPESDRFAIYVGAVFGLGMPSLRSRDAFPDLAKLHYAGLLARQSRPADGLRAILADFFRLPVGLEPFAGGWLELPEAWLCRLGASPETGTLGRTLTVGARAWERQHKFRIHFGPLKFADYERLLPGGEDMNRLIALVRDYVGDELAWDVRLILRKQDVPALRLGGDARLGWTTWLTGRPPGSDAGDLCLDPLAEVA